MHPTPAPLPLPSPPPAPATPSLPEVPYGNRDFATYALANWPRLVVTARLLTGDVATAEELVRRTLVRVSARWRRVPRDDVDFYVRRCLVRHHLARLRGRRAARQRVVLVLRHWDGRPEAEIAQLLGTSAGAVRYIAKRGLKAAGCDARRLREVFTVAAEDVVPSPAPLDAVQAGGRVRRRRRRVLVAACCAALLAPVAFFAAGPLRDTGSAGSSGAAQFGTAPGPVRVVAPGERVRVAAGVQLWLTADGKHWSTPEMAGRFRELDGGKEDGPGISAQVQSVKDTYFLSGLYYGVRGDPGRVEVRIGGRTVIATVLTLAGSPGWGVWYVSTPLSGRDVKLLWGKGAQGITVYDASGGAVARPAAGALEMWGVEPRT